jgi:hypothetical protein
MKKIILIISLILSTILMRAQLFDEICVTSDDPALKSVPISDFIDINYEPIKTIRINIIFLRKNDGTGGFQQNNTSHQQWVNDLIVGLNECYSNIPNDFNSQCYNGSYGVLFDSKIRFDINIVYENNSTAWNNNNKCICPDETNYHLQTLNNQIAQNSSVPRLNIFYTEDELAYNDIVINQHCQFTDSLTFQSISCSQFPDNSNFNFNQNVHMRNEFIKYYWMMNCVANNSMNDPNLSNDPPSTSEAYDWLKQGRFLAHELGHSLNLMHTSPNNCYCYKHLMMNNDCGSGHFISPYEIATIHHALSLTSLRRYVTENTYSPTPIPISQNTLWTDSRRIYRGISIHNGTQFQLANELIIPSEADILVTGNSSFITSNSNIYSPHNNSTLDLIIQQNSSVVLNNTTIQNCNISIQSGSLTLNNTNIDISNTGCFEVRLGAQLTLNHGSIY